jgi:opacity protein-like surface antigen
MNRKPLDHITIRTAVCAALTVLAMGSAHAQNTGAPSYAGASLASTDYGTGLKVFLGGKITPIFGWEGQLTSFGSEEYRPGYKHSAMAIGASGTARFPLNASLSAFGKAGLHYVQPRQSGPGASDPDSSIELGLGAGLIWNFSHTAAVRFELENIGGSDGNFASVGVQFSF